MTRWCKSWPPSISGVSPHGKRCTVRGARIGSVSYTHLVSEEIRNDLAKMPELHRFRVQPGGGMGMTAGSNVELDIYGYDLATTDQLAAELKQLMEGVDGLRAVSYTHLDVYKRQVPG